MVLHYSNHANLVQNDAQFSYEHNWSKIRTLHPKIIGKIYLELNYANLVIKNNNKVIYKLWHNCSTLGHNNEHNSQSF